jgi:anion-transporting  ArsA/GET3 family ATPase
LTSLLDRRLLLVVGKGGVGRTSVAITLALAAGLQGKRAIVVELYGNDQVARRYGLGERSYIPRAIAPNVDTMSLTPYEGLDDFGRQKLKVNALVHLLFHNRVFRAFIDSVPGLHDLFQLGKINHMVASPDPDETAYDLVVIDAPATGHGLTLLAAAESMRDMVGGGLMFDEANLIEELLDDPARTGLVLVTLPQELTVNEGLQLIDQLEDRRRMLAGVVVNQVRTFALPTAPDWETVRAALDPDDPLLELGDDTCSAAREQADCLERVSLEAPLRAGRPAPTYRLARVEPRELRATDLPILAQSLLDQIDASRGS